MAGFPMETFGNDRLFCCAGVFHSTGVPGSVVPSFQGFYAGIKIDLVQKVELSWERGHPARGWLRKIRKMRAGCPRSQEISTWQSIARAFCTGIKIGPDEEAPISFPQSRNRARFEFWGHPYKITSFSEPLAIRFHQQYSQASFSFLRAGENFHR
jgi:hypothetical protein